MYDFVDLILLGVYYMTQVARLLAKLLISKIFHSFHRFVLKTILILKLSPITFDHYRSLVSGADEDPRLARQEVARTSLMQDAGRTLMDFDRMESYLDRCPSCMGWLIVTLYFDLSKKVSWYR